MEAGVVGVATGGAVVAVVVETTMVVAVETGEITGTTQIPLGMIRLTLLQTFSRNRENQISKSAFVRTKPKSGMRNTST